MVLNDNAIVWRNILCCLKSQSGKSKYSHFPAHSMYISKRRFNTLTSNSLFEKFCMHSLESKKNFFIPECDNFRVNCISEKSNHTSSLYPFTCKKH